MKVNQKTNRKQYTNYKLDRDLKECMHCKYFWGNDSRCISNNCCKKEMKKQKELPEACIGCPYNQGNGYCFPCMKKILSKEDNKNDSTNL